MGTRTFSKEAGQDIAPYAYRVQRHMGEGNCPRDGGQLVGSDPSCLSCGYEPLPLSLPLKRYGNPQFNKVFANKKNSYGLTENSILLAQEVKAYRDLGLSFRVIGEILGIDKSWAADVYRRVYG